MIDGRRILELIAQYDVITIFRHEHPDCDALGSQFGLKTWIEDNFPHKSVYALGYETTDQAEFPKSDVICDEVIEKSLALVVDTANAARVDDERFEKAEYIVKIDHHPNREPFGNEMFVDDGAAAVCEILTYVLTQNEEYALSEKAAMYLYRGLLTDTLCFRTSNTTADTLYAASILAKENIAIPEINRELFDDDYETFRFCNFIRENVKLEGKTAYEVITLEDQKKWNISGSAARNYIDQLGHVKEFMIWALFTEKEEDGKVLYDGSLRSKYAPVNEAAMRYGGGGHKNAAGVKNLTDETLSTLIEELKAMEDSK